MSRFRWRSDQKELIDDLYCDGPELKQTFSELRTINKLLGGNNVTTNGIGKLLLTSTRTKISIADVGCGNGDMIRVMVNWTNQKNLATEFIGIDANPNTVKMAEQNLQGLSNVAFETADAFDADFRQKKVDIITCTLFTHHFTNGELVRMFRFFGEKAQLGVVINDLHRHPLAFYSIKLLTTLFSKSKQVKNDAPLSVLRSFRKEELALLLKEAGWKNFEITWHWAFRWQVVAYK